MPVHEVAQFTKTKSLMIRAGIYINDALRDGISEDGYRLLVRDDSGRALSYNDELVTEFVPWADKSEGAAIWESYKEEAGLK